MADYTIISLGLNCLPRTLLTRWGLKPSKKLGEPSMPFDLAVFDQLEVTHCIKTEFCDFFKGLKFERDATFSSICCNVLMPLKIVKIFLLPASHLNA